MILVFDQNNNYCGANVMYQRMYSPFIKPDRSVSKSMDVDLTQLTVMIVNKSLWACKIFAKKHMDKLYGYFRVIVPLLLPDVKTTNY